MITSPDELARVERRRWPIVAGVVLLLALSGVANATIKRHREASGTGPSAAASFAHADGGGASTAWYCAGPLPLGLKADHSSLSLTNVGLTTSSGEVVVTTVNGVLWSQSFTVKAQAATSIALPQPKKSAYAAATVLLSGAGVAVAEEVVTPTGPEIAACVDHATATQYLAGGATASGSGITLALFDPGATPSVANVSFATSTGTISPPAFQELPISAGTIQVLDVGKYLPSEALVATTVTSTGGPIVVGAVLLHPLSGDVLASLASASAVPEDQWYFGPAPDGSGTLQTFTVLNPGAQSTSVHLTLYGSNGSGTVAATVGAGDVQTITTVPEDVRGTLGWASVAATAPVVVARALTTVPTSATRTAKKQAGKKGVTTTTLPVTQENAATATIASLPTSFAVTSGQAAEAKSWIVPGAGNPGGTGEVIVVANPSTKAVAVSFTGLSNPTLAQPASINAKSSYAVDIEPPGPGGVVELVASGPVVAGGVAYASGSRRSVGSSVLSGIPVA